MRVILAISLLLAGCSSKKDALPAQPIAPTEGGSIGKVSDAIENRAGKVAAAVTVVRDNADKPAVVRAEAGVALSHLPKPDEGDLAIAQARAAKADQKDYAAAEAAGKKAMAELDAVLAKTKAAEAEAKRVSDLKDARIAELTREVARINNESAIKVWTLTGAGLAVIGAMSAAFISLRVGLPILLAGAFCGAVPFIIESAYFEYIAGVVIVAISGLGLWWMADKVRDSVNKR